MRKRSLVGDEDFTILSEEECLKEIRGIGDVKSCMRGILPSFSVFAKRCGKPIEMSPNGFSEDSIFECNTEICTLMNEFYYSPNEFKGKVSRILEEVKVTCDKNLANSVFASVFYKIKAYIKEKRAILHDKLTQLGLVSSSNFTKKCCSKRYSISINAKKIAYWRGSDLILNIGKLKRVGEIPDRYVEFITALCNSYRSLCEIASMGIETVCKQILAQCQISNEVEGCNIHKSLFYDYILKDKLVLVPLIQQ
jgi:hypothetical protein